PADVECLPVRKLEVFAREPIAVRFDVERREVHVEPPRLGRRRRDEHEQCEAFDAHRPPRYQGASAAGKGAADRQRWIPSHQAKIFLTRGVRRVRFHASAAFLMASAWVGYGWMTFAIAPSPILPAIATDTSEIMSPACDATIVAPRIWSLPF